VQGNNDKDRWQKADASRNVQDEYLEWSILRDDQGNIKSVTYTCEGPEVSITGYLMRTSLRHLLVLGIPGQDTAPGNL
jgi:hypothetical protein